MGEKATPQKSLPGWPLSWNSLLLSLPFSSTLFLLLTTLTLFTVLTLFMHMSSSSARLQHLYGQDLCLRNIFQCPQWHHYMTWNKNKHKIQVCKKHEWKKIVYIPLWQNSPGPSLLLVESSQDGLVNPSPAFPPSCGCWGFEIAPAHSSNSWKLLTCSLLKW